MVSNFELLIDFKNVRDFAILTDDKGLDLSYLDKVEPIGSKTSLI